MLKIRIFCCLMLGFAQKSLAQSSHYWTQQYGAKSALMGGAVVGSVKDNSAIFYNPAATAWVEDNTLSLSANAYKFDAIKIENGAGEGLDIDSYRLSLYPKFISNTSNVDSLGRLKWGYALLSRNQANIRLLARKEFFADVLPQTAGMEEYVANYENETQLNEMWLGTNIAYKINDRWAIGITQFIAYRNQNYNSINAREAVPLQSSSFFLARASDEQRVIMNNFSLVWKVGISYTYQKWSWGTALTLPSLNVFGFSYVNREIVINNLAVNLPFNNPSNGLSSVLGTAVQRGVPTQFKTPFSWAMGLGYQWKPSTQFTTTIEYFAPVNIYRAVNTAPTSFVRPSYLADEFPFLPNASDFLAVITQARRLINVGLGMQHGLSNKITLFSGLRTNWDYSQKAILAQRQNIVIAASSWNLYHLSTGISFKRKTNLTTVGLDYGFSNYWQKHRQYTNYTEPEEQLFLIGQRKFGARSIVNSFNLIIGFTQSLAK